jgi:hypothetical protein
VELIRIGGYLDTRDHESIDPPTYPDLAWAWRLTVQHSVTSEWLSKRATAPPWILKDSDGFESDV